MQEKNTAWSARNFGCDHRERPREAQDASRSDLLFPLLVDVAPQPALMRLGRRDHRVAGRLEVLGGMVVLWKELAAAHVAAGEARPQAHPLVAQGNTLRADMHFGRNVVAAVECSQKRHRSLRMVVSPDAIKCGAVEGDAAGAMIAVGSRPAPEIE